MNGDHRRRIDQAIIDLINDVYKTHLRKMQSEMHLCAANCCDDVHRQPSMDNVQGCIEDCAGPLLRAQDYMQHELGQFQGRLRNCLMQCNDDVRGRIPSNTQKSDIVTYANQFEICTGQCVEKYIGLIPKMMNTMKSVLDKGPNVMDQM
ncbi:protein FAM136A-like [Musca vetustissima]|uniref:protein FAM136A-like n=1 Tax=Musca vetustissima TaxID=27455 RepID=UPI002AB6BED2|nr:protein FAM136A-like [Musca vetustissima]